MKTKLLICLCVFLMLSTLLCSCSPGMHSGTAQRAVTYFAVPYFGSVNFKEEMGENIEQDQYGRTMYLYSEYNTQGEAEDSVLIIYQKFDDDYVYYYEDICYTLSYDSEEAQETLKLANDWNQPLDEAKMSRRKVNVIGISMKLVPESMLDDERVENAWKATMGMPRSQHVGFLLDDVNPAGQCAYIVNLRNDTNETERYYVIAQPDYEVKSIPFDDLEDLFAKVSAFKKECGWVYGW